MKAFTLFICLILCFGLQAQDGSLDLTFGDNGISETDFYGLDDYILSIAPQSSGKILVGGMIDSPTVGIQLVVVRFNSNGTLDNSFASNGMLVVGSQGTLFLETLPDDSFIVVRSANQSNGDIFVSKFSEDGAPDTMFGVNGTTQVNYYGNDVASSLLLQDDGSLVIGSRSSGQGLYYLTLFRLLPGGEMDVNFGDAGYSVEEIGSTSSKVFINEQDNGALIASVSHRVNQSESAMDVFRFSPNGLLDQTFGDNGTARKTFQTQGLYATMAVDHNDKIVVVSAELVDGPDPVYITTMYRFLASGSPDPAFAQQGVYNFSVDFIPIETIIQPNNRILVSGVIPDFESTTLIMKRFYNGGFPDPSFSGAGYTSFNCGDVMLTSDERIIAGGSSYWFDGDVNFILVAMNNSPLGIEDFSPIKFRLLPNPSDGWISVYSQIDLTGEIYAISDALGRVIFKGVIDLNNRALDLSFLDSGLYYFTTLGNTRRFIIK